MHQLDAVGKLVKIGFDDEGRRVLATAKITDPRTWNDIKQGVLTGFSIGGKYASRSKTDPRKYAAEPFEVSVVDRPCIPGATFEYMRSDGIQEVRKFQSNAQEYTDRPASALPRQGQTGEQAEWGDLEAAPTDPFEADSPQNERRSGVKQDKGGEGDPYLDDSEGATLARADKEPYGDVEYADPGYQSDKKKRYPVDTEEHVRAALSYINHAGNAAKYSPEHLARIKSKIHAAAKRHGIEVAEKTETGNFWDTEFEDNLMAELEKVENDLEKGAKKKATARLKEIRDMAKAHYTAIDGALDGLSKGIAGPDSAQSEGNLMQSKSGEMTSQATPAISFNPQAPTTIGKLAKALGVSEESVTQAVSEINSGGSPITSEALEKTVQATVEKTVVDILERMLGAREESHAVRGPGAGTVKVTKDQDAGFAESRKTAEDDLPPEPGVDPRMQAVYRAATVVKAQGSESMPEGIQIGLAKLAR